MSKKSVGYSIFKHLSGILIWVTFVVEKIKLFQDFPYSFVNFISVKIEILMLLFVVVIYNVIYKKSFIRILWNTIKFLVYLLFYPIVFIKEMLNIWKKFADLIKISRKLETQVISIFIYVLSIWALYHYKVNEIVLRLGIVGVIGSMVVLWVSLFFWVLEPLQLAKRVLGVVIKVISWIYSNVLKGEKEDNEDYENFKKSIKVIKRKLFEDKKNLGYILIKSFLPIFVGVIIVTILGFGVIYHHLQLYYDSYAINGISSSFWGSLYFSALTFSNMDFGNISPTNHWVKTLSILEIYVSLYLLVLIIFMFSSVGRERALNDFKEMEKLLENTENEIENVLNNREKLATEMDKNIQK